MCVGVRACVRVCTTELDACGWLDNLISLYLTCMFSLFMVAVCNRADHIYFHAVSSFFISSPNLSGQRLDVYHTSTHGVALVRI